MGQLTGADFRHPAAAATADPPMRIAALVPGGRRAQRVLDEVIALAASDPLEVTLFAVVAHATGRGCAVSPTPLNDAIDEAATADLDAAALYLPLAVPVVDRLVLREGVDPSLAAWASEGRFDLVVLAGRRRW
jgi:hypothetical protein